MSSEKYVENYLGHAFIEEPAIQRVTRMRNAAQRQFRETVTQLRALQAERKAANEPLPEFPPVREYDDKPKIIPQVSDEEAESILFERYGFVPSKDGKGLEIPPPRPPEGQ